LKADELELKISEVKKILNVEYYTKNNIDISLKSMPIMLIIFRNSETYRRHLLPD